MSCLVTVDRPMKHRLNPNQKPLGFVYLIAGERVTDALMLEIGLHHEIGYMVIANLSRGARFVRYEIEANYLLGEDMFDYNPNFADGNLRWLEQAMERVCAATTETEARVLEYLGLTVDDL